MRRKLRRRRFVVVGARIREISGHDLSCPDTRFNLQLATRAWQTLVGLRG